MIFVPSHITPGYTMVQLHHHQCIAFTLCCKLVYLAQDELFLYFNYTQIEFVTVRASQVSFVKEIGCVGWV